MSAEFGENEDGFTDRRLRPERAVTDGSQDFELSGRERAFGGRIGLATTQGANEQQTPGNGDRQGQGVEECMLAFQPPTTVPAARLDRLEILLDTPSTIPL